MEINNNERFLKHQPYLEYKQLLGENIKMETILYELRHRIGFFFYDFFFEKDLKQNNYLNETNDTYQYIKYIDTIRDWMDYLVKETEILYYCQLALLRAKGDALKKKNSKKRKPKHLISLQIILKRILNSNEPQFHLAILFKTLLLAFDNNCTVNDTYTKLFNCYLNESSSENPKADILAVGQFFFQLFKKFAKGIVFELKRSRVEGAFSSQYQYSLNLGWLRRNKKLPWVFFLLKNPNFIKHDLLPVPYNPKPWKMESEKETGYKNFTGGYYLNHLIHKSWVKGSGSIGAGHFMWNVIEIFESLNRLNSVEFQVCEELLEIMNANEKLLKEEEKAQLELFNKLKQLKRFFYQHEIDFRGRIYPVEYKLHPMSGNFARSLIELFKKYPITDLTLLKRYTSAIFLDSSRGMSNEDLEKYFEKKVKKWLPLEMTRKNIKKIFKKFGHSWTIIRLILEWQRIEKELKRNKNAVIYSNLLVYYDCTASAFQIIALLVGDNKYLSKLNLVKQTNKDKQQDFYTYIIGSFLKKTIPNIDENKEIMNLVRKIFKKSIVASLYGTSRFGFSKNIFKDKEAYADIESFKDKLCITKEDFSDMVSGFWNYIQRLSYYHLVTLLKLAVKNQPDMKWDAGFDVSLSTPYLKGRRIDIKNITIASPVFLTKEYEVVFENKRKNLVYNDVRTVRWTAVEIEKSQRAITANFIQSTDAHLARTLTQLYSGPIVSIHDAWGFPSCNYEKVVSVIKKVFTSLSEDESYFLQGYIESLLVSDEFENANEFKKFFYDFFQTTYFQKIKESNILESSYLVVPTR